MDSRRTTQLGAADLRHGVDPADLGVASTAELEPLDHLVGQDRAIEAIELAATIRSSRFNLFAHGPEGTGRHTAVLSILRAEAAKRPAPEDWVYVHNFETPEKPRALALPRGMGPELRKAMAELVDDLAQGIPALFESEDYQSRRAAIEEEYGGRNEKAFTALSNRARERGVAILRTPMGFALAPMKDGEVQKSDMIDKLPEEEHSAIRLHLSDTQAELAEFLESLPRLEKEHRAAVGALNKEMAEQLVDLSLADLRQSFSEIAALQTWFIALRTDLINNAELFLKAGSASGSGPFPITPTRLHDQPAFHRYGVNVMISSDPDAVEGAPVVVETLPTLANLTGRIEYLQQMGALITDVTMIRPGALHRANGGFLVLDAARVLSEPFAWDALKRCLETSEIRIMGASERMGFGATTTLEPDPVPLDLRVALVGDRMLHMVLEAYDPAFSQLFTVSAEFGGDMGRDGDSAALFARLVAGVVRDEHLLPVSADGVAALVEVASRHADDRTKLSLVLSQIWDILREANHRAGNDCATQISRAHIDGAQEAARHRNGRLPERIRENISRGTIMIATRGSELGQINALTVANLGTVRFGWPTRITARVRLGTGQVVDIERSVKLGGAIHSKGVMILSSYLASHYLPETPLSLWGSLVFEQSYGGIDGDSASVAELCALLSALAGVPLSQSFAVTGSINQMGEVQPVGGVNEKIEGFFDACVAQGLTGRQGVILPRRNVDNLMLRPDVVTAVAEERFHIHAITHVDQALELLTGLPAGKRGMNGEFPPGSVNGNVEVRLLDFAEVRQAYGRVIALDTNGQPDGD